MAGHILDLTKTHFEHRRGNITVFGSWIGREREPALVLLPTAAIGGEGAKPCIVPLSSAWRWSEIGGDGAHCARTSVIFADALGLSVLNDRDVMRVTSIIREHIGDLITIPPTPEHKIVAADAITRDQAGKEKHAEVLDYE